jgi:hypothetical protein
MRPLGAGPESILPAGVRDSGLALRAPRNDEDRISHALLNNEFIFQTADPANTTPHSRRAFRASFAVNVRPPRSEGAMLPQEGSRECRALDAPAALRAKVESTQASHHGHAGSPGIPRAMVLTVSFALSPVTGLCCHRHPRETCKKLASRELDASVGASGPHDFAVRKGALSSGAPLTSTASRPAFVTIASRPSVWDGMAWDKQVIWVRRERKYF